jgi:hypothetical protein
VRRRHWALTIAAALVSALALAEAGLRTTGFASPVLYVADPDYEYFPAPNQRTHRFSTRLETNEFGMRSPELAEITGPRVLVLGDSVVSAINWTDQRALATSLLAARGYGVMNVSAGSWGPGNMLAYLYRHGRREADAVIVVLSAQDYYDDRSYAQLSRFALPLERPRSALVRAFDQYVFSGPEREAARVERPGVEGDARASLAALFQYLRRAGVDACVLRHWTRRELQEGPEPGAAEILRLAGAYGVPVVDAEASYREALARGESIYLDDIHPSDRGQAVLAGLMAQCLSGG